MADSAVVEMEGITKSFGSVVALESVDFTLRDGEIHGLVGDNGAGKSTLIKCLAGVLTPDEGTIRVRGRTVSIDNPRVAKSLGIETAFQDLALAGNLTVTQNIFLGRERVHGFRGLFGVLDKRQMRARAEELLADLEIGVDPDALVRDLSGGERQLVSISRTLLSDPDVIIMDEPTSALSVEGAKRVLDLIEQLRQQGISIIVISHNIEYTQRIADRIKVLYNGMDAGDISADGVTRDDIVARMVSGRPESESASSQSTA
ncbi:ATP-binding cassette domain-containing protein [Halomicrococcus sp. NG-SE-24]|uniref:ATP-binding cassette domain-containing protein n=1 Tax=Halomicrococcus sp. NG-SE-24 TaxID=3436928 RepID=UPI003D96B096